MNRRAIELVFGVCVMLSAACGLIAAPANTLFVIGKPDARDAEFGYSNGGYKKFLRKYRQSIVYRIGKSQSKDWPFIHPSVRDKWARSKSHTYTIRYRSAVNENRTLFFVIGLAAAHPTERSKVTVTVNGNALPS